MHGSSEMGLKHSTLHKAYALAIYILDLLPKKRRRSLLLLAYISVAAAIFETLNVFTINKFLDYASIGVNNNTDSVLALSGQIVITKILLFAILSISSFAISCMVRVIAVRKQLTLSHLIAAEIGGLIFANSLYKPYTWHCTHNSAWLISVLTKNVDLLLEFIQSFLYLFVNTIIAVMLVVALLILFPKPVIVIFPILILYYVAVHRLTKKSFGLLGKELSTNFHRSVKHVKESLGSIRDIKMHSSEPFVGQKYVEYNKIYRLVQAQVNINAQTPRFFIESFVLICFVGLALYVTSDASLPYSILPLMGTLAIATFRLLQPVQQCFSSLSVMEAHAPTLLDMFKTLETINSDCLDDSNECERFVDKNDGKHEFHELEVRDVSFGYRQDVSFELENINFYLKRGQHVALIGPSGSGKSTLIDLIACLLDPSSGSYLVNSEDVHSPKFNKLQFRRSISYVPQTVFLGDVSISANITMLPDCSAIDFEWLDYVCKTAQIYDFIQSLPLKYDTKVGENGSLLSGGQCQRIGIARALYSRPQLIIFDESTSALDSNISNRIRVSLREMHTNITSISVLHNLQSLADYDHIYYLKSGRINFTGQYKEYLKAEEEGMLT